MRFALCYQRMQAGRCLSLRSQISVWVSTCSATHPVVISSALPATTSCSSLLDVLEYIRFLAVRSAWGLRPHTNLLMEARFSDLRNAGSALLVVAVSAGVDTEDLAKGRRRGNRVRMRTNCGRVSKERGEEEPYWGSLTPGDA